MIKYISRALLSVGITVLCMTNIACTTVTALNGRWEGSSRNQEFRLYDGVFEEWINDRLFAKGVYTTARGMLIFTQTHFDSRFLTSRFRYGWGYNLRWEDDMVCISQAREELIAQFIGNRIGWGGYLNTPEVIEELRAEGERNFANTFDSLLRPQVYNSFNIRGDTLNLRHEWGTTRWRRLE